MATLAEQMNNLPSNTEVVSSNEDTLKIIRALNEKEGSNVQVLKDNKRIFGAVDMNDPNRHYIINMDDFDSALGIIEPHEQAVAADPRQAGQLAYKRNWKNRLEKLSTLQKTDPVQRKAATTDREITQRSGPRVIPEPESDDLRTIKLLTQQRQGKYRDFEQEPSRTRTGDYRSQYDVGVKLLADAVERDTQIRNKQSTIEKIPLPTNPTNTRDTLMSSKNKGDVLQTLQNSETTQAVPEEPYIPGDQRQRLATEKRLEDFRRNQIAEETKKSFVQPKDPTQEKEPIPITANIMDNLIRVESDSKPDAIGDEGQSIGLGQIKIETAKNPGFGVAPLQGTDEEIKSQLLNPDINRQFAQDYLTGIYNTYASVIRSQSEDLPPEQKLHFAEYSPNDMWILMLSLQGYNSQPSTILSVLESFRGKSNIRLEDITNSIRAQLGTSVYDKTYEYANNITNPADMQAGGEVPQINKSGLIQGEGGPTDDNIPMRAEPDSFIVNAPAVEMVGKQNLDSAIHKVQKQQQQSGFNQFGNPVTGAQNINVSNGEYKVSKKDAERIGYDNLNRINDAGKPFVEQIDKRGYAEGDRVPLPVEKPSFVPTPIPKPEMLNVSGVDSLFSRADKQNLVNLLYTEDPTGRDTKKILDVIFNRIVHANKSQQRAKDFGKDNVTNILSKRGQFSPVHRAFNKKDTGETTLEFKRDAAKRLRKATPEALSSIERIVDEQLDHIRAGTYKSDVGDSTHYRNVDKSPPDEWWDTALTPYTVGEGGHTFYTIKDPDSSVPRPTSKPKMKERAFVDNTNYQNGGITSEFTKQEQDLLRYHQDNLYGNKYLKNDDGSLTTLYGKIMSDKDGTAYLVPGYNSETREKMTDEEAWNYANTKGLENFPSYSSVSEAQQAEIRLKKIINQDMEEFLNPVNLLDIPMEQQQKDSFMSGPTHTVEDFYPAETVQTGEESFQDMIKRIEPMN